MYIPATHHLPNTCCHMTNLQTLFNALQNVYLRLERQYDITISRHSASWLLNFHSIEGGVTDSSDDPYLTLYRITHLMLPLSTFLMTICAARWYACSLLPASRIWTDKRQKGGKYCGISKRDTDSISVQSTASIHHCSALSASCHRP